jgi:hypothetical protein
MKTSLSSRTDELLRHPFGLAIASAKTSLTTLHIIVLRDRVLASSDLFL